MGTRQEWVRIVRWGAIALLAVVGGGCATVPTRPAERLALVEIQINNTSTQSDDYVAAAPGTTAARVRIGNVGFAAVPADVPVEIRNMDPTFGGQVAVGTTCASLAGSAFVVLPRSGAWVNLCLRSTTPSTVDKDAVLEVLENRTDGIVLARAAFQTGGAAPTVAANKHVDVRWQDSVATADDYVTWVPRPVTVRLANPGGGDVSVRLSNAFPSTTALPRGRLLFGLSPGGGAVPQPSAMTATLDLVLPGDGAARTIYVAGEFGQPSRRDKDAVLQVRELPDDNLLGRAAGMVRIRRDANQLSTHERDRFLRALVKLNGSAGGGTFTALGQTYFNYQTIHDQIGSTAHSFFNNTIPARPAFMPWHRLFIVRLERELQALDPSVALPYWDFSETDPAQAPVNLFHGAFLGITSAASQWATFDASNPMSGWSTKWPDFATSAAVVGVRRFPRFGPNQLPTGSTTATCTAPVGETAVLALGSNFGSTSDTSGFMRMEWRAHNRAHVAGGGFGPCTGGSSAMIGWLASRAQPIQDPLFFLLHSNVDRQWAAWQQANDRFDPQVIASFPNQGVPGPGDPPQQFLLETLWPWNTSGAPGGTFPLTVGQIFAPPVQPMILNAIDYQQSWVRFDPNGSPTQLSIGLGYDYDDVPFSR